MPSSGNRRASASAQEVVLLNTIAARRKRPPCHQLVEAMKDYIDSSRPRVAWYLSFPRISQSSRQSLAPSPQRPVVIRHDAGTWHTSSMQLYNNPAIHQNSAVKPSHYKQPQTKSQASFRYVNQLSTKTIRIPANLASGTGRSGPLAIYQEIPRRLPKPSGAPPYAHSSSIKTAPQVPNPPSATSFQAPRSISKRPPVRPVVSLAPPSNDRSPSRSEALVDAAGREDSPKIRNPRCQGDRRDTGGLWQAETTHGREQSLPTVDRQPPSDENSEARQNAGATLHLDGAALGRWTIQHIERALARPSNGMTGVDPRATMPRGHISPF